MSATISRRSETSSTFMLKFFSQDINYSYKVFNISQVLENPLALVLSHQGCPGAPSALNQIIKCCICSAKFGGQGGMDRIGGQGSLVPIVRAGKARSSFFNDHGLPMPIALSTSIIDLRASTCRMLRTGNWIFFFPFSGSNAVHLPHVKLL